MKLRFSLWTSTLEGALAELVAACGTGAVTTAWALYLGLSPFVVGLLGALPLTAMLVQPPTSFLSRKLGNRAFALWAIGLSRQCVLPLAALPFVRLEASARQTIFLVLTLLGAALAVAGNNAWTAWMGDLVPGRVQPRYFGRRAAACALASAISSLGAGVVLQKGGTGPHAGAALSALALTASAIGAATTVLLRRQGTATPATRPSAEPAASEPPHPQARPLLVFNAAWSAAVGLAAAFVPLHLVGNLGIGFAGVALYGAGVASFRMLTAPIWGRLLEKTGARHALLVSAFALSLSPLLLVAAAPSRLWPLALEAALSGAGSAGLSLALFQLPVALARPAARPRFLGALAAAGGAGAGLASAAGGAMLRVAPPALTVFGRPMVALQGLLVLGGAARVAAAFLGLRVREPVAATAADALRQGAGCGASA